MEVLKSLFTIAVIVLLGVTSRRTGIFDKTHVKTISSFVYYFALPSLIFVQLSETDLSALAPEILIGSVLPILVVLSLLYILKAMSVITKDRFILLSLSIAFGSNAFFGVAFFETLYDGRWLPLSIVTASFLGLTGILSSLILFEYASKKEKAGEVFFKILRNPLVISIFSGLLCSIFKIRIEIITGALGLVGKTSSGLAIFALGIFMYDNFSLQSAKKAFGFAIFRMLMLPLTTGLTILVFTAPGYEMRSFLLLQSGIPSAISMAVFAERYGYRLAEITGMVVLTSVFSFISLIALFFISGLIF
jgi:predicted permease